MTNMNLIGVFVPKLWPVQALACGGGVGGSGGATKNILSPKFSNFRDNTIYNTIQILFASSTHKNIHLLQIHNIFYTIIDDAGGI